MKTQKNKIMVPIEGQQRIQINFKEVPNIEWNQIIEALLLGAKEYYANPENREAFEARQKGA